MNPNILIIITHFFSSRRRSTDFPIEKVLILISLSQNDKDIHFFACHEVVPMIDKREKCKDGMKKRLNICEEGSLRKVTGPRF
jgi:hypothetical protein